MPQTKNKSAIASDTWLTPADLYAELDDRFKFDSFDPCPSDAALTGFNGLTVDWAPRTFCNPPYSRKLKEAFIDRALQQSQRECLVVMLLPVSTSSRIFHEAIKPYARVEFIEGRLAFEGIDGDGIWINPGKGWKGEVFRSTIPEGTRQLNRNGQNDAMLAIFGGGYLPNLL